MTYRHPPNVERVHTKLHDIVSRGRLSETTRRKYRLVVDQWVLFAGSNPNGWTRSRMEAFRAGLLARGMSPVSITTYLAGLRYASKWYASELNTIDFSIIQPIEMPSAPKKPRRMLSYEQAEALLRTCVDGRPTLFDIRDFALIVTGLETGLRVNGLARMMFEKFGTSNGPSGPYPSVEVPIKGRGGKKTFKVPLSDTALAALERWHYAVESKRGPVFRRLLRHVNRSGETIAKITASGISETAIYKMIVKRALDAEIGHVHPHILRHTFITWRENDKVRPAVVASVTGHVVKDRGEMSRYLDMEALGEEGRRTTPPWFAALVRKLLKEF